MALETLQIEHVPSDHHVYAALFRDVQNVDFLQAQLIGKNPEFEYAFIDASVIISRTHLFAAIFRALNTLTEGTLQTPNVHSDIVIGLNPTNNVRLSIHTSIHPLPLFAITIIHLNCFFFSK